MCRTLNPLQLNAHNRTLQGQGSSGRLAYLIARGGTPALRDEVAEALWPDGDRAQVDHLLYNAAYYLRRTLNDFVGNEPYEWAEAYRREYQRRFIDAAHRAAKLAVDQRDIAKAVEFYQAILARDPIDEEAARSLMRCYSKLGDVNGVRKVYKVLCESLRRELEDDKAEPLPETTALVRELAGQPRRG